MLDNMRAFASTWVAKILIAVLIVGLSVWGISNVFVSLASTTIGTVGDQEISSRQFQRSFSAQLNAYAQQTGIVPTADMARNLGIPSVVIQQLAANAALNGLSARAGLGAADSLVARRVAADPSFAGAIGGLSRSQFTAVLRQNGFTESEYLGEQANAVRREHLTRALFLGTRVPDAMREIVARFEGDTRTIEYFTLTSLSIDAIPAPTDAELTEFLAANQAAYRTVETRDIAALVLTAETLAPTIEVSDDDARARYEQNAAAYVEPPTRAYALLDLPAPATVAWFNHGLGAGKSFETLVEEAGLGEAVVEIGATARDAIPDAAVAEAVFSLQPGEFAVLDGASGPLAVHVTAATEGGQRPFEEVAAAIRAELALTRARDRLAEVTDEIEELRAALQPIGDIAARYGLAAIETTVDRAGGGLDAIAGLPAEDHFQVSQAVFAADPTRLIPSIPLGGNETLWFDVTASNPARDLTLEEARDRLATDWTEQKTDEALAARAAELAARIGAGEDIMNIAFEIGAIAEISAPIGRAGDGLSIGAEVAEAAFGGGPGHAGFARTPEGDYVVFAVTDLQPADTATASADLVEALQNAVTQTVYGQFIARLVEQAGLRINEVALNDLLTNTLTAQ